MVGDSCQQNWLTAVVVRKRGDLLYLGGLGSRDPTGSEAKPHGQPSSILFPPARPHLHPFHFLALKMSITAQQVTSAFCLCPRPPFSS